MFNDEELAIITMALRNSIDTIRLKEIGKDVPYSDEAIEYILACEKIIAKIVPVEVEIE